VRNPMQPNELAPLLVLASSSPTRRRLLEAAGVAVEIVPARIDEEAISQSLLAAGESPRAVADALAETKAKKISARLPDRLVLGADQVLSYGRGQILHKATSRDEARAQLLLLRGTEHSLISAAVLAQGGSAIWRIVDTAKLHVRSFSDAFLDAYLAAIPDDVLMSVGCYQIEALGAQLFKRISGDHFTIQGLPLLPLLDTLRDRGIVRA
jgi:septum formation protein